MLRALLEIIVEFSAIFIYIWHIQFTESLWIRNTFLLAVCIGFPLLCIFHEKKELAEFSLDGLALVKSVSNIFLFTFSASGFLVFISFYLQEFFLDDKVIARLFEYMFWSFLQQIGLQTFLTRRIQKIISDRYRIAFVSAALFSLIHFPNFILVCLTGIGGFFWVLAYLKTPNLYPLAVSHGWLAVLCYYAIPGRWIHDLKIGPSFWQ